MDMTAPKLSPEELDELFIYILRLPEVYDEAMSYFRRRLLVHIDGSELDVIAIILVRMEKEDSCTPRNKSFDAQLTNALSRMREEPQHMSTFDEQIDNLLSDDGLLNRAFNCSRRSLEPEYGKRLLKRLLIQRTITEPLYTVLQSTISDEGVPQYIGDILRECSDRYQRLEMLVGRQPETLGSLWLEHEAKMQEIRGRDFIGLKTGLRELDRRTLGLRGITVLGAKPGAGKTTFALNAVVGVCRYANENDCAVLFVSLDMNKFEVISRIRCLLADMSWGTLVNGSIDKSSRIPESFFNEADQVKLKKADQLLKTYQLDTRLTVVDREEVGDDASAERLRAMLQDAKSKVGASRGLIVIDYLQLLSVPDDITEAGDLGADKYRIRVVQRILEGSRSDTSPLGDAAIVIAEARKPPNSKETWGDSMSDLMGSARVAYAADAVLLYREMSNKELTAYYGVPNAQIDQKRESLRENGAIPVTLILEKGRDGMARGPWSMEFHFKTSKFEEISAKSSASSHSALSLDDSDPSAGDAANTANRTPGSRGSRIPNRTGDLKALPIGRTNRGKAKRGGTGE